MSNITWLWLCTFMSGIGLGMSSANLYWLIKTRKPKDSPLRHFPSNCILASNPLKYTCTVCHKVYSDFNEVCTGPK